VGKMDGRKN